MTDESDDASDPVAIEEKRKRGTKREEKAREFWRKVFADPVGRQEMWGILEACHAFGERFACGPNGFPQPEATWFEAGQQAFGQRLWKSWLRFDHEGVVKMIEEYDPNFAKPKRRNRSDPDGG